MLSPDWTTATSVIGAESRSRRLWAGFGQKLFLAVCTALALTPISIHLIRGDAGTNSDNRTMAAAPPRPTSLAALAGWPAKASAYLSDHFGLRQDLIRANNSIRWHVFGEFTNQQLVRGRNGRMFLGSHARGEPYSMLLTLCGALFADPAARSVLAHRLTEEFSSTLNWHPEARLIIVPTSSVVHDEDLPRWVARRCARGRPLVADIIELVPAENRNRIIYPEAYMRRLKSSVDVFPKVNFHWSGLGVKRTVEMIAEQHLGKRRQVDIPGANAAMPSDVIGLNPGVALQATVFRPDFQAAGITLCRGSLCFPEPRGAFRTLNDVTVVSRAAGLGGRLLVLSDSFGAHAVPYFAEYYSEVWHASLNFYDRLSPDQRREFRAMVLDRFKPDGLIFVYHDGNLGVVPPALSRLRQATELKGAQAGRP